MTAKEYLKKIAIEDRVLNKEDLSEYWKSISTLMEEYAAQYKKPNHENNNRNRMEKNHC